MKSVLLSRGKQGERQTGFIEDPKGGVEGHHRCATFKAVLDGQLEFVLICSELKVLNLRFSGKLRGKLDSAVRFFTTKVVEYLDGDGCGRGEKSG